MKGRLTAAIIATLLCCGCYDRFDNPQHDSDAQSAGIDIADLHGLWFGSCITVNDDIKVGGRVTSSDKAGNFYRTFTICDDTGGLEILAGPTDLHNRYPVGCYVSLSLKGCAIDENYGVLQVGLPAAAYNYTTLNYMQSEVIIDRHIFRNDDIKEISIPVLGCTELDRSLCGCPVTVAGVSYTGSENGGVWSGYVRFEDADGNAVYTSTSSYADFADNPIPAGKVSVTGILQFGTVSREEGEHFILKMRDEGDCSIDN